MRWVTATTCTSSPTPQAAFLLKHTIWQSAAWWLRELNPLPGLAWRENFSVIGRAQSALGDEANLVCRWPVVQRKRFSWVQHFERKRYDTKSNDLTEPPLPSQT